MLPQVPFTVEKVSPWVTWITFMPDDYAAKDYHIFFPGDIHHDSPKCNRHVLHRHLKRATDMGAIICSIGDQFDVMEGRYDPRRKSRKGVRPENDYPDYLDLVIKHWAEDVAPYAPNWAFMGYGNHETSILKNLSTDLIQRSIERMKMASSPVVVGAYAGMIGIRIKMPSEKGRSAVYRIYYHHGFGGGAPVTDGIIDLKRHKVFVEGVDLIVMGHKHTFIYKPEKVMRFTKSGEIEWREVDLLRVDSYKDLHDPEGWAIEKGFKPPTIGGALLTLRWRGIKEDGKVTQRLLPEITRWR